MLGRISDDAPEALSAADRIVCAGDTGAPSVLLELENGKIDSVKALEVS